MSEFEHKDPTPFRETELVSEEGYRTRFIDANTPEAEGMEYEDFWHAIIGEDPAALGSVMSLNLQAYFGKEESPDELVVVLPLHDTSASSAVRAMYSDCWKSYMAIRGVTGGLYLPALNREVDTSDTLISIEEVDWASNVPHHDGRGNSYSVFRAAKAKLPKGFLEISGRRLSEEQWAIMRGGLSSLSE